MTKQILVDGNKIGNESVIYKWKIKKQYAFVKFGAVFD